MKNRVILLLIIILTIGFASVSVNLILNGATTVAFDNNKLKVVFKRVRLNNEESENVIIDENGKSFVYIADDLTSIGDIANIEYAIKNESSIYDASVIVSCTTDYEANIEYNGNTLNQVVEIKADEGYTDTLTTKLTKVNISSNSIALKCSLIVNPESRDTIMLGKEYNVTFDSNGGSTIDASVIVKYYEKYGELPIPTKKGYEFQGWYTEDGEKVDSTSLVKIKDNHKLIAKWKRNTYQLITDVDGDGRADIGDEIQVGTENFYVISQTDTEINALAKYNLKVGDIYNGTTLERTISSTEEGYGRQDASMVGYNWQEGKNKRYGTVAFSNTGGIDIRSSDGPVKDALYGEKGYERYLQEIIPNSSVRLITVEEIKKLINKENEFIHGENIEEKAKEKGYTWLYSTTYWTQNLWGVYSHGSRGAFAYMSLDGYYEKYYYGVRPVITIITDLDAIFNITFDANGGNAIDITKEIKYENKYGELPTPVKEGYEFLGWYTENREKVESTTIMNMYKNHTLKAGWKNPNLKEYEISYDVDLDGEIDIGDEIKVGTESFYVISYNNTELNALAKYNLKVGGIYNGANLESTILPSEEGYGRQDAGMRGHVDYQKAYGTVTFSNQTGWPNANNATIDIRNQSYGNGPVKDALYGENGYEKYLQETIPNSSVRLITKGEIEDLVNDGNELTDLYIGPKATVKGYSWLYYTTYWIQSSSSENSSHVWRIISYGWLGHAGFDDTIRYGVRPVITIPLT